MNFKKILLSAVIMLAFTGAAYASTSPESIIDDSLSLLKELAEEDDISAMADTIRGSYAVALVPSMVKAGFIVGQ